MARSSPKHQFTNLRTGGFTTTGNLKRKTIGGTPAQRANMNQNPPLSVSVKAITLEVAKPYLSNKAKRRRNGAEKKESSRSNRKSKAKNYQKFGHQSS